jgi:hypothetical protein
VFIAYIVLIIQSLAVISILLVALVFAYRSLGIAAVAIVLYFFISLGLSGRVEMLFVVLSEGNVANIWQFFVTNSGFRAVGHYAAVLFSFMHPFGGGLGGWQASSLVGLEMTGVDASKISFFIYNYDGYFAGVRPVSFVSNVLLDFGIVGFLIMMVIFVRFQIFRIAASNPAAAAALLSIFFFGAVGSPYPWVVLALSLRSLHYKRDVAEKDFLFKRQMYLGES